MLVKKIDIHVHSALFPGPTWPGSCDRATPEELLEKYDKMGIELGVLLPGPNPEGGYHTTTNEENLQIVQKYPHRFQWFCNLDPRMVTNDPEFDFTYVIEYYKALGAKGIGELCCNLSFDDPRVENLFAHAEKCGMPVIFHIGKDGKDYGLIDRPGLPLLEQALQKFPRLKFLGHSQRFWAELGTNTTFAPGEYYPRGKVTPGRVVELLEKYDNLCCDLSAGSGQNAMLRDPEFTYGFLERFQDRLYFGTDICSVRNDFVLTFFLDEAVEKGFISQQCYNKVCRDNALALLGLSGG